MRCDRCGFENDPSATRCTSCGNMLPLSSEQVERAWLAPEPERPPPWQEAAEREDEPVEAPPHELDAVWGDAPAAPSLPAHELRPPEPPAVPVAMPAPPPPPPEPAPRRDRWPAVRRILLALEILGALAFAVLAYLEGSHDYLWTAAAFGALPLLYLIVAAIRGAGSRALTVPVALVLAGVLGFSAFTVITDCENRLEPRGDLSGCDLTGLDLAGLDLSGADLSGATLAGVKVRHANLRDAKLNDANLQGADLADVVFDGADLTGADLREADVEGSTFTGAVLAEARLSGLDLDGLVLIGLNLAGADLTGATLETAKLEGANLTAANLQDASMSRAELGEANLARANLSGADLSAANLNGATLTDATITGTVLDGATLIRVVGLSDAQLADALGVGHRGLGAELAARAIRLEARSAVLRTLGVACRGRGVPAAAELAGAGRRLLVLAGAEGGASPMSDRPAQLKWEPMAARFGQLVACVDQEEAITVELCQYFLTGSGAPGPPTRRLRFERRVRVVAARTGEVLSDVTHTGSTPASCPFTKTSFGTGGEDRIEGSHVGFDAIRPQLAEHVSA